MRYAGRILIVDSSETQACKLRLLLESEGGEVSVAPTAESALLELDRSLPALIIVASYLPQMRGSELCRRIKTNVRTANIPILLLTSDRAESNAMQVLPSPADECISRSEGSDSLLLRIRRLLDETSSRVPVPHRFSPLNAGERRTRLLAVDDSPTQLEHVAEELQSEGYEVDRAANGIEALERMGRKAFDCVLVDLVMPGMSGIEVCSRITEMNRTQGSPMVVIMLTSRETKDDITRCVAAGADDFVGKSSDLTILKARLVALMRRRFFQEELARANRKLAEANRKLQDTQMHLIQSEKMASLGQLVAGIAHEINNPLAFVLNNLFLVDDGLARIVPEITPNLSGKSCLTFQKVRVRLDEMKQGLDRVKELVLNLRTFSRLDEGEFKTIDIHESIDSALLFLNHKMKGRILLDKQYGFTGSLSCYAGRLNQVLLNLVANAVDAIEGQGKITITTLRTGNMVSISVKDTGKGIPEQIRNRIFEPFFTTKPVGQGTGLGLAISYGIIQAHQGAIEVSSEEGKGTEMTIKIPADLSPPKPAP